MRAGATTTTTTTTDDAASVEQLASDLRLVVGRMARRLRQQALGGLGPSQLSSLATLDRHGPLHPAELARLERVSPPTIARQSARLEELGLLSRRADPDDGRSVMVEITPNGREALARVRGERTAFLAERLEALRGDDLAAVEAAVPVLRRLADESA